MLWGDVDKWRRFANTLRLRLALRVSNVDPALAQTQAKAALTDPAGLMQSQDDNMKQTRNVSISPAVMKISTRCCSVGPAMLYCRKKWNGLIRIRL